MKLLGLMLLLLSVSNTSFAQLEVIVKGIKGDKGSIRVGVFKDEKTFLKKAAYGEVAKAQQEVKITFNIPPGKYAISVIHDENENGELDSNFIGIPKEGFGFANDAMGNFGPPSFEKAAVTVETGKRTITITLRYL